MEWLLPGGGMCVRVAWAIIFCLSVLAWLIIEYSYSTDYFVDWVLATVILIKTIIKSKIIFKSLDLLTLSVISLIKTV